MLIDAHNHLQDWRFDGIHERLISEMKSIGITACVVNGTSESDWTSVQTLAEAHPDFIQPAFGLHPWKISERSTDWLGALRSFLEKTPHSSLGECGLDRWIHEPHFEEQMEVFKAQLDLAVELSRPVTIHCLKAWGPLMEILRARKELPAFLLHSFNGSLEIARELTAMGAYFSFSGHFLHERKNLPREVFKNLPSDRVLVETDAPDMLPPESAVSFPLGEYNHPANLARISEELIGVTQITQKQLVKNTQTFFKFPE
ncbi:MAG: TatD family hydrolase [Akkermansiaceae bacterium]